MRSPNSTEPLRPIVIFSNDVFGTIPNSSELPIDNLKFSFDNDTLLDVFTPVSRKSFTLFGRDTHGNGCPLYN